MIEFFMQIFTGPFYAIMNQPYGFSEFFLPHKGSA